MSADPDVTMRGVLEIKEYGRSKRVCKLVACPFCTHEFEENEARWKHFLDEHGPEDAGLSPIGERYESRDLFKEPELVTDGGFDIIAPDCEDCGERRAGAIVDERELCAGCALEAELGR